MPQNRRAGVKEPVVDDYPVRPDTAKENEKIVINRPKSQTRTLVTFSLVYFLYGCGISLYGLLYPELARKNDLNVCIYGSVIASSYFVGVLFYPVACRMCPGGWIDGDLKKFFENLFMRTATIAEFLRNSLKGAFVEVFKVSMRNILSVSIFTIGGCRILFGTLGLIHDKISFTAISYCVQLVEGVGIAILIACSVIIAACQARDQIWSFALAVQLSLCLGLTLGPIGGEVAKQEIGFDIPFYIAGGLTVLSAILTATLLKEPDEEITFTDMPIVSWMKDKKCLIYFSFVFATFNYVGFLSTTLELILKKFSLNYLYFSMLFSISPFVYGLAAPTWKWLIRIGFNNVMLILIGAIVIFTSLTLLGPAPFTTLETSLTYACWALVLEGLGVACKFTCIMDALEIDLRFQSSFTEFQQKLLVSTILALGTSLGCLSGSLIAGIMDYFIGYRKATLFLFALEIYTAICATVFAMSRNYISKRRRERAGERLPILNS